MRYRLADGFGDRELAVAATPVHRLSGQLGLSFADDFGHHANRFSRILSAGGLGREHGGISAVEDRISYVAGFGTRWTRILDHRLQHLRGCDHGFAPGRGATDHMLLDD